MVSRDDRPRGDDPGRSLGPQALLAVTQLVVLDSSRARAAEPARAYAAAALPNRLAPLRDLGQELAAQVL